MTCSPAQSQRDRERGDSNHRLFYIKLCFLRGAFYAPVFLEILLRDKNFASLNKLITLEFYAQCDCRIRVII